MKVDLVIGSLSMGGAERQLVGLATELQRMGIDVEVIIFRDGGPLQSQLVSAGIKITCLSLPRAYRRISATFINAARLIEHWTRRRPDAVQAWLGEAQVIALPIAHLMGIPVRVMAIRSLSSSVRMTPMKLRALRVAVRSSTSVIANSHAALADAGWPISALPRHVVPNAVDLPPARAQPAIEPATGVVLANFLPYKGHAVLLEALASLPAPPKMLLLGTGPLRNEIATHVERLGLSNSVEICEGVTDPWPLLLKCQFSVLPSRTEGMPNAVLEAMAAGLPVVASRVGGIPDLIADGVEGFLVEPSDVDDLARAIALVINRPSWRTLAGARGRLRARKHTWSSVAKRNLEIMRDDLGRSLVRG